MEKKLKPSSHGHFLKNRFLRNIFIVGIILALTLPVTYVVLIHPAFTKLVIEDKVDDATSIARHLSSYVPPQFVDVGQSNLPVNFFNEAVEHKDDFGIKKLKVFAKSGEVIFSTDSKDVGTINRREYLRDVIEKGRPHIKVVKRHAKSLEGQTMSADVVETYVPLIKDDSILGAFEIYYDITRREEQLHNLLLHSSAALTILAGGLLFLIIIALFREHKAIAQREHTEEKLRESEERKRAEEIVRNIAEGVSASTGEIFFQSLVRQLAQMLEMDYALVGELIDQKEEEVETVAVWANNEIVDNFTYELANTPCQNVVGQTLCSYSNNVQEQFPLDHMLQEMNVECYVGVPLFDSRGRPLGIMALLDGEPLESPEFVESTLRVFAARASAELERRAAETAIRQAEEQYRLLVQNLPSIVYKGYRDWSVDFFDDKKIRSLLGYNLEDFISRKIKWSEVIVEEDLEQATREFIRAMKGDKFYVREYRIKTRAGDILWIQDRGQIVCDETGEIEYLSGVFFDITDHKHTDEALRKSEKELRFLSTQLLDAQERERARFARELHDGIGQALSTMKVRVETLAKIAKSDVSQVQVEDLENLVPMIRQTIEEVRNTSMDLRPSTLDSLGIVPTIDWFSREFKTTYPFIQIEKEIDIRETEVPDPLKIVIYRIVQEAFNNVARHSRAQMMFVSLAKIGGEIILAVRDNGRGFDPEDLLSANTAERGFGITSMKERTELSGGSFSIESGIGKGTTVRATWKV
jgi:PAS domain S-box-containing protein